MWEESCTEIKEQFSMLQEGFVISFFLGSVGLFDVLLNAIGFDH